MMLTLLLLFLAIGLLPVLVKLVSDFFEHVDPNRHSERDMRNRI
jgi:hypothetical protein